MTALEFLGCLAISAILCVAAATFGLALGGLVKAAFAALWGLG